MPIRLNRLGSGLDLHNDQPWTVSNNQVHLKLPNPPIGGQHFPSSPHHVFQSNLLAPPSKSLTFCFHAANIAHPAISPRYFCLPLCRRHPSVYRRFPAFVAALLILTAPETSAQLGSREMERDIELGRYGRTRQTWDTANKKWRFGLQGSASIGAVLCATDVRWMGVRTKHLWHISGWGGSASAGAWVQFGRFRALARIQAGWLEIGNSRYLASNDLSGETPVVTGLEANLLDASRAHHAMAFLEKGITLACLFGKKSRPAADERVRTSPSR